MKWGILATGNIAKKFASTINQMSKENEQLVAVGSRNTYRKSKGLLTSDQIVAIRNMYDLSQIVNSYVQQSTSTKCRVKFTLFSGTCCNKPILT